MIAIILEQTGEHAYFRNCVRVLPEYWVDPQQNRVHFVESRACLCLMLAVQSWILMPKYMHITVVALSTIVVPFSSELNNLLGIFRSI